MEKANVAQTGKTADKDKVPVFEKIMYGLGSGSFQLATDGVKGLANPIYNIVLGLDLAKIGLVLMLTRLYDAFNDPIVAKISDDFRSPWGRRRPFIFVGSFLTAIAFIVVWFVPIGWIGMEKRLFYYFLAAMLLFYTCSTIQVIPYHTLGLEMTADYDERTSVSGYKMMFSFMFTLTLPWFFRIAQAERFGNPMIGIRYLSFFIAGLIVVGGVLPAIFTKERYYRLASQQSKISFWQSFKTTMQNRSFLLLNGMLLLNGFGGGLVGAFGPYIVYYYMFDGDTKVGHELVALGANVFSILALISTPIMVRVTARLGKVRTLVLLQIVSLTASLLTLVCYNKRYPYLIFVVYALQAPVAAGFWTIITSMKADICDDDELRHGRRREAMFGAVGNWVTKTALSSTHFFSGVMLNATGLQIKLGGDQAAGVFTSMRVLYAVVPVVSIVFSLILLKLYPLTAARMGEIRTALEERRDTIA